MRHPAGDARAPGRSSASTSMRAPDAPIASGILMRRANGDGITADASDAVAAASSSAGDQLPDELRGRFESSLGTDLSAVRVHTGPESATSADAVGARAYTVGNDIHFGAGEFDPGSARGQELIAHEVAHTVQQRGGTPGRQYKLAVSQPGDAHEVEADRAAPAMVAGAPAVVSSGGVQIARDANPKIGAGSDEKKRKVDTDAASVPDGTVDIKMFGKSGKLKFGKDGLGGNLKIAELPKHEEDLVALEYKWPIQLGAGGGVMIVAKGGVKVSAGGSVTVAGSTKEFGGPRENTTGFEGTLTASGTMGLSVSGRLEVLGYFGAGFANINAGGYVELSGSISAGLKGTGTIEISPEGLASGSASAEFANELTVKGTGGITIGWEALIASGKFYECELVSHDFLTAKLGKKSTFDFSTGAGSTTDTSEPLKWKPITFTQPKELKKGVSSAAKKVVQNIKDQQKKQGNDMDNQQSIPPEEKKQTDATDCDPDNASCE